MRGVKGDGRRELTGNAFGYKTSDAVRRKERADSKVRMDTQATRNGKETASFDVFYTFAGASARGINAQIKACLFADVIAKGLLELGHLIRSVEVGLKLIPKIQGLILAHLGQDGQPGDAKLLTFAF